jgi:DNA-binding response OmpR family regulator
MIFGRKTRQIVRLLLVEDEPLVAFDNEHVLSDAKFEVVATMDRVADAVALIEADTALDLVLVDVTLADGSGVDVARAAHARGIGVLFVTGNFPAEAMAVADACLAKPYSPRDLLGAIAAIEATRGGRPVKRMPGGLQLFSRPD